MIVIRSNDLLSNLILTHQKLTYHKTRIYTKSIYTIEYLNQEGQFTIGQIIKFLLQRYIILFHTKYIS